MIESLIVGGAGGLSGILGSAFGQVFSWLERKQQMKLKELEYEHELRLLDRQAELRMAEREQENEHALEMADINSFTQLRAATYEHDSNIGEAAQWVINILRLVRPALTVILIGGALWAVSRLGESAVQDASNQLIYLATTAVSWWFMDRRKR